MEQPRPFEQAGEESLSLLAEIGKRALAEMWYIINEDVDIGGEGDSYNVCRVCNGVNGHEDGCAILDLLTRLPIDN